MKTVNLDGADLQLARVVAESALIGDGFEQVVLLGRGAVRVDVLHVLGLQVRVPQAGEHGAFQALPLGVRGGDMVGVA
jgi:hypothetical protein